MSFPSNPPDRPPGDRRHVWLTVVVLAVLAGWAIFSAERWDASKVSEQSLGGPPPVPAAPRPATAAPEPHPAPVVEVAADGLPIMPRDTSAPTPPGPVHPHPVTEAHLRIYRENNLLGALNGAMDEKDASGLWRLLAQYRAEYPDDPHELQQGYEIVADCIEHPGAASTARARRYYETETASTLRRYVRRHCFENGS